MCTLKAPHYILEKQKTKKQKTYYNKPYTTNKKQFLKTMIIAQIPKKQLILLDYKPAQLQKYKDRWVI